MALLLCNCACNSFSSSIVGIASWDIASSDAILRDSLVRYPLESSLIPLARIKSSNSFIGSFPVHNLSDRFLGKGAFNVPLPAFVPVLIDVFAFPRAWLHRSRAVVAEGWCNRSPRSHRGRSCELQQDSRLCRLFRSCTELVLLLGG